MQVQEIMTSNPTCCGPDASVQEAAKLMDDKSVGSIPVVNDAGEPVAEFDDTSEPGTDIDDAGEYENEDDLAVTTADRNDVEITEQVAVEKSEADVPEEPDTKEAS